jgi:hypothetical protein
MIQKKIKFFYTLSTSIIGFDNKNQIDQNNHFQSCMNLHIFNHLNIDEI